MSWYDTIAFQIINRMREKRSPAEIDMIAGRIFLFDKQSFPNPNIPSITGQTIYDWVKTIENQELTEEEKRQCILGLIEYLETDDNRLLGLYEDLTFNYAVLEGLHLYLEADATRKVRNRDCADAVETAFKKIESRVKKAYKKSTGDELFGTDLMFKAFNPDNPIIKVGDLTTISGRDEQRGAMHLFAGAFFALRNPKAHSTEELPREQAVEELYLASLLMTYLDRAGV